ncbi:MAG: isoprenyl transferase [Methylococcales bacterium]|nr:isoprenyl transferase [Methylococcales bacterium]
MSNDSLPTTNNGLPRHIAIIMDGNGRWAKKRFMPRVVGHKAGVKTVKELVDFCTDQKIEVLSLFAFSSENWRRPQEEVSLLMKLFVTTLRSEVKKMMRKNVKLVCIGERAVFSSELQHEINEGERLTKNNDGLTLVIAVNYGGHWDIAQAANQVALKITNKTITSPVITETLISQHLSTASLPDPDLFIRTGGEQRISNFLLWQLAYTEFYFTPTLWPDFNSAALQKAIDSFKGRQRRFGRTGDQVLSKS